MLSDDDIEIDVLGCDDETATATAAEDSYPSPYHEFLNLSDEEEGGDDDEDDDEDDSDENEGEFAEKGKRAHHNALEKQRREDMKRNYRVLKNTIPWLKGKKASRCVILKTASAFLRSKRRELALALAQKSKEEKNEKGKKGQDGKEKADQK